VTEDGSIYTWGFNDEGQLGVADVADIGLPVLVRALNMNAIAE
jgi:alpha-tubulin suppressor-like RCC1 family protein